MDFAVCLHPGQDNSEIPRLRGIQDEEGRPDPRALSGFRDKNFLIFFCTRAKIGRSRDQKVRFFAYEKYDLGDSRCFI